MTYYHGTTNHRFKAGETIKPGREAGIWSNPQIVAGTPDRELESGRTVGPRDVVWITSDPAEAENWAHHSTLKALPHEIRAMPAGGIAVYEIDPEDLDHPVDKHGDGEACCSRARVIREVIYDPFPTDLCDECGETATEGLGTDNQLCAACAEDERNNR